MMSKQSFGRPYGSILVVDKAPDVGRLLTGFFRRRGFFVHAVATADAAMAAVRERRPDIVLLDVSAAHADGLDLLEALCGPDHGVTVIAMANDPGTVEARRSLELGAADFLAKPINFAYLETSVTTELITGSGVREAPETTASDTVA
jgi:two-component system nitrogen regulation response regulator NtrX